MAKRAPRGGPALAGLTLLDLLGPQTALAAVMDVHLLWKTVDRPVVTDTGISIHPTMRLADCPQDLDVLFVPGGPGMVEVTRDREVLDFLADRGPGRLGDVGLQRVDRAGGGRIAGRLRATSHRGALDLLPVVGAEPVAERVVTDRNRITAGGVTAR